MAGPSRLEFSRVCRPAWLSRFPVYNTTCLAMWRVRCGDLLMEFWQYSWRSDHDCAIGSAHSMSHPQDWHPMHRKN